MDLSLFEQMRLSYQPKLPKVLHNLHSLMPIQIPSMNSLPHQCAPFFSHIANLQPVKFEAQHGQIDIDNKPLRVGVILSGGQAAGGHNVIAGVFDSLAARHPESTLIGFLNGARGLLKQEWKELDAVLINDYRNTGGFEMLGSGREKIETPDQFACARETVQDLSLDGLIIIGGDDSNTNAALLAEDFLAHKIKTLVIGVPKTIDGDLKNQWIEASFGFDTACKVFSNTIASLAKDAASGGKYYYFIKLMGRTASHITLECALQTQPNLALIGEEIQIQGKRLSEVASLITNVICERAERKKDYGIILLPEGLIEFIPECRMLIQELNSMLHPSVDHFEKLDIEEKILWIEKKLSPLAKECFHQFPLNIQTQLLLERDPHGNVQVSKIEIEKLFIDLVKTELDHRKSIGTYKGKFSAQGIFCGYEGRSCYPSNFDANYCYALGHVATLLISGKLTGYMACVNDLAKASEDWDISGVPLICMMHEEARKGIKKPVIRKTFVNLQEEPFKTFTEDRNHWILDDAYLYPGPLQFFGPVSITDAITKTLELESIVV